MPAAVETYKDMAAAAFLREPAWHGLGTVLTEEVTTAEMLRIAHLADWDVRLEPLTLPARSDIDYWATVRTNPFDGGEDMLGVVKKRYRVYQNEDLLNFGDDLLDGGGTWESAGSLKNGRVVFGALTIGEGIVIDPEGAADKIDTFLLVTTSHDGSISIQALPTNVRVVCMNTLSWALASAKNVYKIRHTENAEGRIAQAREALGITFKYNEAFEAEAKALYEASVTDLEFNKIITTLYPKPEEDVKGAVTKWESKINILNGIYFGETTDNIRGTAWGAYNALTERMDWFRSPRGGNAENAFASASGFDVAANAEKNRLLAAVKEIVTV